MITAEMLGIGGMGSYMCQACCTLLPQSLPLIPPPEVPKRPNTEIKSKHRSVSQKCPANNSGEVYGGQ